ncbi:hypothetical protein [Sulfitobacter mediterraneus]|uniref:hypothetical protein n=1 Tax=Sulfitobacter mediterraneus TaxID=83219 RepID=UPI0013C4410B|nr:hypothetical protein [Sulfitobacter mediterraneus]
MTKTSKAAHKYLPDFSTICNTITKRVFSVPVCLCTISMFFAAELQAKNFSPLGQPEFCGTYNSAHLDLSGNSWHSSGEAAPMNLSNPVRVNEMNAILFDTELSDEGFSVKGERIMFLSSNYEGRLVLFVTYGADTKIYEECR